MFTVSGLTTKSGVCVMRHNWFLLAYVGANLLRNSVVKILLVSMVAFIVLGATFLAGVIVKDVYIDEWTCIRGRVTASVFYAPESFYGSEYPLEVSVIGEQILCAKEWKKSGVHGPTVPRDAELRDWIPDTNLLPWKKEAELSEKDDNI